MVKRGSIVELDGQRYIVTAVEHYGFFCKGRRYIVLWSDKYKVVE